MAQHSAGANGHRPLRFQLAQLRIVKLPIFHILPTMVFSSEPFSLGSMHRLTVMPQSFLRKSLWHPCNFGPFRPSVTVGVKRNAFNYQSAAGHLEK